MLFLNNRILVFAIISILIGFLAISIYKNTQLKLEVIAVKNDLSKAQEALLVYAKEKEELIKRKEKALGILKDDNKSTIDKFNSINSTLF